VLPGSVAKLPAGGLLFTDGFWKPVPSESTLLHFPVILLMGVPPTSTEKNVLVLLRPGGSGQTFCAPAAYAFNIPFAADTPVPFVVV